MNIGKLRHRVALQSFSETVDSYGEAIATYATYATVWGSIEPLSGKELLNAQQQQAEVTIRIKIRYLSTVTEKDRVLFGDDVYEITSAINKDKRNEFLELLCKEVR